MGATMCDARIVEEGPRPDVHHVYPVEAREHITSGTTGAGGICWCRPDLYRVCTACDGDDWGCWCCDGDGVVPIEAMLPGDRVIVVHHFIPDDATFTEEHAGTKTPPA
jgi:hypothetical protein